MRRRISGRGQAGEPGAGAGMALRGGLRKPLDGRRRVARRAGLLEVYDPQQILGLRMALNRHGEEDVAALRAGARRCGEPLGHGGTALDVAAVGRRRLVRLRHGRERREEARRERQQPGESERGAGHRRILPPAAARRACRRGLARPA